MSIAEARDDRRFTTQKFANERSARSNFRFGPERSDISGLKRISGNASSQSVFDWQQERNEKPAAERSIIDSGSSQRQEQVQLNFAPEQGEGNPRACERGILRRSHRRDIAQLAITHPGNGKVQNPGLLTIARGCSFALRRG